jgi:hypothetical protein
MTTKQGTRPSRITDLKKWQKEGRKVAASVTTVLNVLDKPALVNWKVDQHLETVFDLFANNAIQSDDYEGFLRKVKSDTQDRMDLAPQAGTDIHKVLENFIANDIFPTDLIEQKICLNVKAAIGDLSKFQCEKYFFDEALGYAGCADLVSDTFVIDFKSKQTADKFKAGKMVYAEHSRQLAAYSMAFHGRIVNCANIFVCLENGDIDFHLHKHEELENGWLDFKDCLSIYKRNNLGS